MMRARQGFTLFELLAVITIIGIALAVTLGAFQGWGDASAVRGSAELVEAALTRARDYAAAQRAPVRFEYQTLTATTNTVKRHAEFMLVREPSLAVATNAALSAAEPLPPDRLIGPIQRLPGNAWLLRALPPNDEANDTRDRFVFLPGGRVHAFPAESPLTLFVTSRRTRGNTGVPTVIYQLDVDRATGAVTVTKRRPEEF